VFTEFSGGLCYSLFANWPQAEQLASANHEVYFDGVIDGITLCNPLHVSPLLVGFLYSLTANLTVGANEASSIKFYL
jgi:hypothetical protein